MESFKNKDGKDIVLGICEAIKANKDYLSDIDGAIGDGDHGINMNKGFSISAERIAGTDVSFSQALYELGDVLLSEIGGSMGPIYGTLFMEMGDTAEGAEDIDSEVFAQMMNNALDGLCDIVDARVGDKTLMDVMIPAAGVFDEDAAVKKPFSESLSDMVEAAEKGRDSTKDLVAKFGRASRLGERTRGVLDAGATSCAIILKAMAEGIQKKLEG